MHGVPHAGNRGDWIAEKPRRTTRPASTWWTNLAECGTSLLLAGGLFLALGCFAADRAPLRGNLAIHDPSTIIKCKDRYYVFGTGQGIISRSSSDRIYWTAGPIVFATPPTWAVHVVPGFTGVFWAPDIIWVNGRYCLYYSVSTWGSQLSAIGLVTNPTLDPADPAYRWTDQGVVIQSATGSPYNTIDPSVMLDSSERLWLTFGSYWTGIYIVQLDPATGKRITPSAPVLRLAYNSPIEASCLYQRGDWYYLFVNWGSCCSGVNSTYNVRVGRSRSPTGPYLDRDGVNLVNNGGSLFLEGTGKFTGPGHIGVLREDGQEWLSYHYYDAGSWSQGYRAYGTARFDIAPLSWTEDGWPAFTNNNWSAIYTFDQEALDANGQHSGLLAGKASTLNDPLMGGVLRLDGTNSYVQLPPSVAFARTFSAVVKWDGGPAWQRIFDFGTDTARYVMLTPSSGDGKLRCDIKAGGAVQTIQASQPLPVGVWTRVAVTFGDRRGVLYVNETPVATNANLTLAPLDVLAQSNHLGRSKFIADPDFRGQIADFRVHGRALTRSELADWPETPSITPEAATNNFVAYYPFHTDASDTLGVLEGLLQGGASIIADPARGNVLNLAGNGQFVSLPPAAGNSQTVAGWVKWNGGAPWQRVFDFGRGTSSYFFLTPRHGGGRMQAAITAEANAYVHTVEAPALPTNVWTRVAVLVNGLEAILVQDGRVVGVNNSVNLLPSDLAADQNYFGESQFPADATLSGRLSSFCLSSRDERSLLFTGPPDTAPALEARAEQGTVILSWPISACGWSLRSGPDLSSRASWNRVNLPATLENDRILVRVKPSAGSAFFTLRREP